MAILETKNLSFTYPNRQEKALTELSFSVDRGALFLVMGKSGSGKSTLLRLLKSEIAPFGKREGEIVCAAERIGFVFQNPEESMITDNVVSELAFSLENMGADSDAITQKISECAAFFNLNGLLDKKTSALSGGEKQLVSLAAAMITAPQLLLLDEPCAGLDPAAAEKFVNVLLRLNRELGTTVIMSTHNPDELLAGADRVLLLENGTAALCAPPQAFAFSLRQQAHEMLAAMPASVRLFDSAPLCVREAIPLADALHEKPVEDAANGQIVLRLKNICFAYDRHSADILYRLNLQAEQGRINAVVGVNGSGKSTLLKVAAGVLKPYAGKIQTKSRIALLPQTVQYLFTKERLGDEIDDALAAQLGLTPFLEQHPMDLSGGEARLLGLGLVLQTEADILLLDEPTCGLDALLKIRLAEILQRLCSQGKTVLLVTHDLEFAGRYAHKVSFLCDKALSKPVGRRSFFSNMDFYTTQVRRITRSCLQQAVSEDDLI